MKKEFLKDYFLKEEVSNVEILNSKVVYDYTKGKCFGFKVICSVRTSNLDKKETNDYEIEINDFEFDCEFKDQIKVDILNVSFVVSYPHLILYGTLDVDQIKRDEPSLKLDPFKKSLMDSFIEFKRNKEVKKENKEDTHEDVEILNVDDNSQNPIEINNIYEMNNYLNTGLGNNVEIVTTLDDEELKKSIDLIKKDDQISVDNDQIIIEEPIEVHHDLDGDKSVETKDNKTEDTKLEEKPQKKDNLIKDNYVSSFFYYRLGKNETLTDVLFKYKISMNDFLKYNQKKDYGENSLIKLKKKND